MSTAEPLSLAWADREIRRIMDHYKVYAVFNQRGKYAVWAGNRSAPYPCRSGETVQVTEPASHKDAQAARTGLIAADILDLFQDAGWVPHEATADRMAHP